MKTLLMAAALLSAANSAQASTVKHVVPSTQAPLIVPQGASGGTPATLALVYSPESGVLLQKGIRAFSSPLGGIYCITPSLSLRPTALPTVQVEWGQSMQILNEAQWYRNGEDCSAGDIEVITVDNASGALGTDVAFTVKVE